MNKSKKNSKSEKPKKLKFLPKMSLVFFDHPKIAIIFWLALFIFGIFNYTTLLKREGFPSIAAPYSTVNGVYLVNDSSSVDSNVTKPLVSEISNIKDVKTTSAQSNANSFNIIIEYKEGTNPATANAEVEETVKKSNILPVNAIVNFKVLDVGSITSGGEDMLVAFFGNQNSSTAELTTNANKAVEYLKASNLIPLASKIEVINPYDKGINPITGQETISQKTFDWFGTRQNNQNIFYPAVSIGITGVEDFDVIKLDEQVKTALNSLNGSPQFKDSFRTNISFGLASNIQRQISELQKSLLEGLLAILIICALLIAIRASVITVVSMLVVLATTLVVLYLIDYTLNTITLFSLILCLTLIVDDTIIMVDAIDAQKRKIKSAREAISHATEKISKAMIAATFTAMIAFAPLLFVSGILGNFIRAIPITVIASLLVSLVVSLMFIPFIAKYLIFTTKSRNNDGGGFTNKALLGGVERWTANGIAKPLYWAQHSRKKLIILSSVAILIGLGFIVGGGMIFQKVTFNIFPPTKDSDGLYVNMNFLPNTNIKQAEDISRNANNITGNVLGDNFLQGSYFGGGNVRNAQLFVDLIPYSERKATAPQLVSDLQGNFNNFGGAQISVTPQDVGPPAGAFKLQIVSDNKQSAYNAALEVKKYLETTGLQRSNGEDVTIKQITITNPETVYRKDNKQYVELSADFKDSDTTALVLLAKKSIKEHFTDVELSKFGLNANDITYDFGSESQNQDSFNNLLIAFPILLVAMYILLIFEFKSFLQPVLIFFAIPFSFFGITLGLLLTNNSFSFFSMLGFFALIGLSVKNTILLTDYANQSRRAGYSPVDSIANAIKVRFRPLIATSLTAMVSIIPLAIYNPFWESLAVTLIFGLLSSTFLVVTVFPYYYLGAEFLRIKFRRKPKIA